MNPPEGQRRLEELRQLTRGALAEMRTLLVELRPNALTDIPLSTLLRQLTEAMISRSRIAVQLSTEGDLPGGQKLPGDVGLLQPDVILMDIMMPVMDGIAATQAIKKQYPKIQIVALTSFQEDELVQNALKAGAVGYLMKNVTAREPAAAIRSAKEGKMSEQYAGPLAGRTEPEAVDSAAVGEHQGQGAAARRGSRSCCAARPRSARRRSSSGRWRAAHLRNASEPQTAR